MKEIRDKGWAIRELNIQQRAKNKDKNFVLFLSKYLEALEILKFVIKPRQENQPQMCSADLPRRRRWPLSVRGFNCI